MALNVANLNASGLRDASKCVHLLAELSNLCLDVAAVQETNFIREADCQVLKDNFVVFFSIQQPHQHWGLSASWTQS